MPATKINDSFELYVVEQVELKLRIIESDVRNMLTCFNLLCIEAQKYCARWASLSIVRERDGCRESGRRNAGMVTYPTIF